MSAVEVDRVFDEYDNNNDGKIDIDEYIGHATFSQSKYLLPVQQRWNVKLAIRLRMSFLCTSAEVLTF